MYRQQQNRATTKKYFKLLKFQRNKTAKKKKARVKLANQRVREKKIKSLVNEDCKYQMKKRMKNERNN